MRSLLRRKWVDATLDYHRGEGDYRVRVLAFANIDQLTDLYFVRPRSARLLWNYLAQIGPVGVWRKVLSRLQERVRNEKYVSFGYGEILEAPEGADHALGDRVAFFAPGFPACVERVVLPEDLMLALDEDDGRALVDDSIAHLPLGERFDSETEWWRIVRRWDSQSGEAVGESGRAAIRIGLEEVARKLDGETAEQLSIESSSQIEEFHVSPTAARSSSQKRTVLFGYGHYAKTNILPNVRPDLFLEAVHEVDPTQIPPDGAGIPRWDTSPVPRPDVDYDVYLIAGYHHTHAPLAVEALQRGVYAVAEKPIAVDHAQLDALLDALDGSDGAYLACFHKRYSPLNDLALHDLREPPGSPIDYYCIVYEVPLPDLHWYRWPNSKSRLVSNGCHWLDHFLYMNGFSEVADFELGRSPSDVLNCSVTLENGAYFTMVLTDNGSERIGLQDYVEMRAGEVTAKIVNNATYVAEDRDRVIRRTTINKITPYKHMYRSIASRIAAGEGGDTPQSIRVSTRLVLDLEEELVLQQRAATRERAGQPR
jgi:predicted dehydrogenase